MGDKPPLRYELGRRGRNSPCPPCCASLFFPAPRLEMPRGKRGARFQSSHPKRRARKNKTEIGFPSVRPLQPDSQPSSPFYDKEKGMGTGRRTETGEQKYPGDRKENSPPSNREGSKEESPAKLEEEPSRQTGMERVCRQARRRNFRQARRTEGTLGSDQLRGGSYRQPAAGGGE